MGVEALGGDEAAPDLLLLLSWLLLGADHRSGSHLHISCRRLSGAAASIDWHDGAGGQVVHQLCRILHIRASVLRKNEQRLNVNGLGEVSEIEDARCEGKRLSQGRGRDVLGPLIEELVEVVSRRGIAFRGDFEVVD